MIVIVDYGAGNPQSVQKAYEKLRLPVRVSGDAEDVRKASRLVLPGVGHWNECLRRLRASGLEEPLRERVTQDGAPLLGICVGMQILAASSEEGEDPGLALLPAKVVRFPERDGSGQSLRVPHVGWNLVEADDKRLLNAKTEANRFYFTHSYYMRCDRPELVAGWCDYGLRFAAAVRHKNLMGVQFHPERSQQAGLALLKRFAEERF